MDKYLIKMGSQIKGPVTLKTLKDLDVSADTLVCKVGENNWVPIVEIDELLSGESGQIDDASTSAKGFSYSDEDASEDNVTKNKKHQDFSNSIKSQNESSDDSSSLQELSPRAEETTPKYQSLYVFSIVLLVFSVILGVLCVRDLWWNEALIIGVIPFILTFIVVLRMSQIRKANLSNESGDEIKMVKNCRWMIGVSVVLSLLSLLIYETNF